MNSNESGSFFIQHNGTGTVWVDEKGEVLTGERLIRDGELGTEGSGDLILRFDSDGLLHGDGRPAVEGSGHLEYWRHGSLHREYGLPAVICNSYKDKECWVNGKREQ